jgi:hypothetical protein
MHSSLRRREFSYNNRSDHSPTSSLTHYTSSSSMLWPTILGKIAGHGSCTREEECQAK